MAHKEEAGTVVGLPGVDTLTNEEILELDCDMLVPAAIDCVIHSANAPRVKVKCSSRRRIIR